MFALVGTIGAENTTGANTANSPAWGTNENRTAGDLLVLWCLGGGVATLPTTPSGWTIAKQTALGTVGSMTVYWKRAAGADTAPTIAAVTGVAWRCMLGEFTGASSLATPTDQTASNTGTTATTLAATAAAADLAAGELVITLGAAMYSAASTANVTDSFNNGVTANSSNNNGASATFHYDFSWGITTGHGSADSDTITMSTGTNLANTGLVLVSFQAEAFVPATQPFARRPPVRGLPRRAHSAEAPTVLAAPPAPPTTVRRSIRGQLARRGRTADAPVAIPAAPVNPPITWAVGVRRRGLLVRKGRSHEAPVAQPAPPPTLTAGRRRGALARRGRTADSPLTQQPPPPPQFPPNLNVTRRRGAILRKARSFEWWKSLVVPPPPPPPPPIVAQTFNRVVTFNMQIPEGTMLPGPYTVNVHGGGLATLFEDGAMTVPMANPFQLDGANVARFSAADGYYDIQASYQGTTYTSTVRVVTIGPKGYKRAIGEYWPVFDSTFTDP